MGSPFETSVSRVRETWGACAKLAAPVQVLRETWPKVLPHYEGLATGSSNLGTWLEVVAAFDELSIYRDRTTLLRRAVEILRSPIGLERAAIFLLDASRNRLVGTWGTGADGETTDEQHIAFDIGPSHREALALAQSGTAHWARFAGVPLFAQTPRGTVVLRSGENVLIPIPGSEHSLGVIACDWALTGRKVDTQALERATVLTRLLSAYWQREPKQQALPDPGLSLHDEQLASRVAAQLRRDPNIERDELSRCVGASPDRIGRSFKAALGEPLSNYRNRLRLQRYFALVDPAGGNLLQAALDAGFGSYAQFHRVFRRSFGCAPIEHLRSAGR